MSELQTRPERRRAARASTEAALRDLIHALAGTVEVEELAQRAAQACATATGALGAYIERVDVSAAEVEIIAAVGEQTPPIGTRVPYPGSLTDELIKRGTPEVLADVTDVGERMAPYLAESCNHCIGLVAPLNGDSGVVGSLVLLQAADQAPLREDEIDRVITIGEVASIALRRVHILSRERQAREHLTILAETGSLLDAGLDFQTLLDRFAHLLVERLCDWCVIYVPTSRGARRAALAGRDPETELAVRESLGEVLTEPSDAPAMQVLRTGKSMLLSDVSESALEAAAAQSPIYARILREHRPRSAIAVPLIARGDTIAAVSIASTDPSRRYDDRDLGLAEEIARRAALALANAKLYEEATARVRTERLLRRAAAAVTAQSNVDTVVSEIARNALVALEASGAFVERVDTAAGQVIVVAAAGDPAPNVGASTPYRGSYAERVVEEGSPERIRDLGEPGRLVPKVLTTGCAGCPALVVPLLREGTPGALFFLRAAGAPAFTEDEVTRAAIFGELAGLAFRKAHLLRAAEQGRAEAEAAVRARDDMLAVVSHDLRNPVHTIAMSAALLDDPTVPLNDEEHHKQRQIIKRSAQRMNRLIQDLLDVSRIESGRFTIHCGREDAASITAEVCEAFAPIAEGRRQSVRCELATELPPIHVDRDRIVQVLGNFLDNALKFSPERAEVLLRVDRDSDGVRFCVRDQGVGIAPEALAHVFERYWQDRRTAYKGAGLGLAIAKGIAEAHGGRVWAESKLGEGAEFFLWLPVPKKGE